MLVRCFSQASQEALENFAAKTYQRCSSHSCIIALQLLCSSLVIFDSMTGVMYQKHLYYIAMFKKTWIAGNINQFFLGI